MSGLFELIVANPPYVAEDDPHLAALGFEPATALVNHGMVRDKDGVKMSKRLGNATSPIDVALGARARKRVRVTAMKRAAPTPLPATSPATNQSRSPTATTS